MYFHTDDPRVISRIAEAAARAKDGDRRLRFNVDSEGRLSYKVGEGMWSPPEESTPDPYRG